MNETNSWPDHAIDYTRKVLRDVEVVPFSIQLGMPNKGCMMQHFTKPFGYIKMEDALNNIYPIYDYDSDELLDSCNSIDEVINAGWKVST